MRMVSVGTLDQATSSAGLQSDPVRRTFTTIESALDEGISIVVPTYNEAENIEQLVSRLQSALEGLEYELLIVDDDSPDNTWRIAQLLYETDDRVRVLRRVGERGLASAILYGFSRCEYRYCAVLDADLQHPPEAIPRLLLHADDETDVIIGSRYTDFGRINGWSSPRRIVSKGAVFLAKAFLPQIEDIDDPLSGFFLVERSVVEDESFDPIGYKLLLEVLVRSEATGVREVPFVFEERNDGESKLTLREYVNFVQHVLKLRTENDS